MSKNTFTEIGRGEVTYDVNSYQAVERGNYNFFSFNVAEERTFPDGSKFNNSTYPVPMINRDREEISLPDDVVSATFDVIHQTNDQTGKYTKSFFLRSYVTAKGEKVDVSTRPDYDNDSESF